MRSYRRRWIGRAPARGGDGSTSADERRSRRLVSTVALLSAPLSLGLAVARYAAEGWWTPVGNVVLAAAAGFALVLVVQRAARARLAEALVPLVPWLALTAMAALDGGLRSDAIIWLPFVVFVATLVLGTRGAALAALACEVTVAGLTAGHFTAPSPLDGGATLVLLRAAAAGGAVLFAAGLALGWERTREEMMRSLDEARLDSEALLAGVPDTIARLEADGRVRDLRPASGERLLSESVRGELLTDAVPDAAAVALLHQIRETLTRRTGTTATLRYPVASDTGPSERTVEVRMAPAGDHVVATLRDVTELERARTVQDDFVSTVSHELRTPLTAIHGGIGLLRGGARAGEDARRRLLDVAYDNSLRLGRLVDDLLDVQKLRTGGLDLHPAPTPAKALLEDAVARSAPFAELHGVGLEVAGEPTSSAVDVDRERMSQVLANLVSNAIKHSPRAETVRVRADHDGSRVRLSVIDRGCGIPIEQQERIFERFTQIGGRRSSRDGTGLGLHVARVIVEGHGGTIEVRSAPGAGARFDVLLPRLGAPSEPPAPEVDRALAS